MLYHRRAERRRAVENFTLYLPTRYCFGKGVVAEIGKHTASLGRRALLVSGKASARRSGLLDRAHAALEAEGIVVRRLEGVDPNPRLSTCREGARRCVEHGLDVVVSVGGGSALDCSKVIALLALDAGDPWDFFTGRRAVERALPVVAVLTVAATGSEYGPYAVVTNEETGEKLGTGGDALIPKVALVDPELTFSVPRAHTVHGAIDIMSHHLEAYLTGTSAPTMQDEFTEAVLRAVMRATERILERPDDYEARAELLWANTLACGVFMGGRGAMRWDAHAIEHELSAAYDVAHGAGLAVVLPALMRWRAERDPARLVRFARTVLGLPRSAGESDRSFALRGVEAFRAWCHTVGAPVTLSELGVREERLRAHAENIRRTPDGAELQLEDILRILSFAT
jgi:alcohol dehydrogenase YqhD (iron-dependent ADH family)